jgi:hypothetical protein
VGGRNNALYRGHEVASEFKRNVARSRLHRALHPDRPITLTVHSAVPNRLSWRDEYQLHCHRNLNLDPHLSREIADERLTPSALERSRHR